MIAGLILMIGNTGFVFWLIYMIEKDNRKES